jgi:hypothetical protein
MENSRLGVIFFLGNLQVDFSPEKSASKLKDDALKTLQSKLGTSGVKGKIVSAAKKVGGVVDTVEQSVDAVARAVQDWLVDKFDFAPSDVELAIQHVRYNLPPLISDIHGELQKTASDFGLTGVATGLYTGITKTIEYFNLKHVGKGVSLQSGHPDLVAASIQKSVAKSALVGLAEAALAGAKAALAAFTGGVGLIINKLAGVIELLLRFAVRFCDGLSLRKIFADCKERWACRGQTDALQKRGGEFANWFKKTIDRSPIVAALVMNCGIAGDAMRFLEVATSDGVVLTQGQFDKGVTYLNALKASAADLIMQIQKDMRIWSEDLMCSALLKHAEQIGLIQKEAGSSWRAKIFTWTHQEGTKSSLLNRALDAVGYKQSTPHGWNA